MGTSKYCGFPVSSGRGLLDLRFRLGQEPSLACPGGRGGMVSFGEEIPEGKGVR